MFEIHDLTAAPHLPEALKPRISAARPESLFALLAEACANDTGIEVRLREGEVFIVLTAS